MRESFCDALEKAILAAAIKKEDKVWISIESAAYIVDIIRAIDVLTGKNLKED